MANLQLAAPGPEDRPAAIGCVRCLALATELKLARGDRKTLAGGVFDSSLEGTDCVKLLIDLDRNHRGINGRGGAGGCRHNSDAMHESRDERDCDREGNPERSTGALYQAEDMIRPVVVGKEFDVIARPEFGHWYVAWDNSDVGERRRALPALAKWDSAIGKLMGYLLSATKRYKLRLSPRYLMAGVCLANPPAYTMHLLLFFQTPPLPLS
jgi:hypothetical protein